MSVTAEGVENLEQMDFLKEAGCQKCRVLLQQTSLSVDGIERSSEEKNLHSDRESRTPTKRSL